MIMRKRIRGEVRAILFGMYLMFEWAISTIVYLLLAGSAAISLIGFAVLLMTMVNLFEWRFLVWLFCIAFFCVMWEVAGSLGLLDNIGGEN